jgi:hypothetical protein
VRPQKVEKGSDIIESRQNQIEGARIGVDHPFPPSQGGRQFRLSRRLGLKIQEKA